jgi:APA family basic amino acid/polyamine antiporter
VPPQVVSVLVIVIFALVNIAGTRSGSLVQNLGTFAKAGGLILLSALLIATGSLATAFTDDPSPVPVPSLAAGIGAAMIATLWAYEGWQYVTFSAGEARDPQHTFPRAISAATLGLVVLYLLANLGYLAALGPAAMAGSEQIAADAVATALGPGLAAVVGVLILVSIASALNGILLTAPRKYFAMARDGVFFARLAEVHPRTITPVFAIGGLAAWAAVLAVTGTFVQLLTYVVFTGWAFYALGALSIFVYRRRAPEASRAFRTPGYPVTPIVFVAAATLLVLNTLVTQPGRAFAGLGLVALGAPAFYFWRSRARRAPAVEPVI